MISTLCHTSACIIRDISVLDCAVTQHKRQLCNGFKRASLPNRFSLTLETTETILKSQSCTLSYPLVLNTKLIQWQAPSSPPSCFSLFYPSWHWRRTPKPLSPANRFRRGHHSQQHQSSKTSAVPNCRSENGISMRDNLRGA